MMSCCDYLFGPVSTFSRTAHFLGHNLYCPLSCSQRDIKCADFKENVKGIV